MRHLLVLEHVFDMCFTLLTSRVCEAPEVPAEELLAPLLGLEAALDPELVPVISTS